jgi:hypothetical protein
MLGGDSELRRFSQYSLEIECPQCGKKMTVHIWLIGEPQNNEIECAGCHNRMIPLLPGPMVDGPFLD